VPGCCSEEPNPLGPLHWYETPAVGDVALSVTTGTPQVMVVTGASVTPGKVLLSWVVTVEGSEVHPLTGSVTVTAYVPETFITGFLNEDEKLPGPLH
jgi:hypothetical protein